MGPSSPYIGKIIAYHDSDYRYGKYQMAYFHFSANWKFSIMLQNSIFQFVCDYLRHVDINICSDILLDLSSKKKPQDTIDSKSISDILTDETECNLFINKNHINKDINIGIKIDISFTYHSFPNE